MQYRVDRAFRYYKVVKRALDDKSALVKHLGFVPRLASDEWEIFAAVLTNRKKESNTGLDLRGLEVKSSKLGGSFEYQYHAKSFKKKLAEDIAATHLFISYDPGYDNILVYELTPELVGERIASWRPKVICDYEEKKQRSRHSLSFTFVKENGRLVMEIKDGNLV